MLLPNLPKGTPPAAIPFGVKSRIDACMQQVGEDTPFVRRLFERYIRIASIADANEREQQMAQWFHVDFEQRAKAHFDSLFIDLEQQKDKNGPTPLEMTAGYLEAYDRTRSVSNLPVIAR